MGFYLNSDLYKGDSPTWEQIYEVIKSLDGKNFNCLYLELDGIADIYCGGGDLIQGERRYVVGYLSADKNCRLINPEEPEDKEYEITIQTPDVQLARWCVKIGDVIAAFKYFYENEGDRNPNLHWECN